MVVRPAAAWAKVWQKGPGVGGQPGPEHHTGERIIPAGSQAGSQTGQPGGPLPQPGPISLPACPQSADSLLDYSENGSVWHLYGRGRLQQGEVDCPEERVPGRGRAGLAGGS